MSFYFLWDIRFILYSTRSDYGDAARRCEQKNSEGVGSRHTPLSERLEQAFRFTTVVPFYIIFLRSFRQAIDAFYYIHTEKYSLFLYQKSYSLAALTRSISDTSTTRA